MYDDTAVILPGRGAVFYAEPGAARPTNTVVETWLNGNRYTDLSSEWKTIGHTSLDELPSIGSETEGGETKGSWENPSLRTTAVTTTDTLTVTPIQWDLEVAKRRFGAGAVIAEDGSIELPDTYTATEDAVLILFIDGDRWLGIMWPRGATAPEGDVAADSENFLGAPFRYTKLSHSSSKAQILGRHLAPAGSDQEGGN